MNALLTHLHDKQHVIWDWNGTLLSDIDHAVEIVNRMLREEGLNVISVDEYRKVFGFPVIDYYQRLGFNTSPAYFSELCERFNNYFHEGLGGCQLWSGARETLESVQRAGKVQSVLSASEHGLLLQSMKMFELEHLFDHVFGIGDKKAGSKIDRGRELMARVRLPKDKTILVGDTDHDLEVGDALGIEVILVEHGHQCPTRLHALHHRVLKIL